MLSTKTLPQVSERVSAGTNNFGFVRLCLASLVIFGHAPEMIDGDSHRELISMITGSVSAGGLSVIGFFFLSGYLISQSMLQTADISRYAIKRALRIVPAFVVAYVLSVFVIAPILGASPLPYITSVIIHLATLHEPPAFFGSIEPHYKTINGAMWTIIYEIRCYALLAALWRVGILSNRNALYVTTFIVAVISVALSAPAIYAHVEQLAHWPIFDLIIGRPSRLANFVTVFLIGACVYQSREYIIPRISYKIAIPCGILMLPAGRVPFIGNLVLDIFASLFLLWLVTTANIGKIGNINRNWDISYGVYLYGWPIAMVYLYLFPHIMPFNLALLTLCTSLMAGAASWIFIEKKFKLNGGRDFWHAAQMVQSGRSACCLIVRPLIMTGS